ncbi:hypothetical protein [Photobacterium kishitanii]|uniref:hypothetical protein n=1 Tax=Photobacterium kishitanii TaxID=318456 RepID=UPI00071AEB24|nr:hypothetical protein [Photobacterium kishitanii]
MLNENTSKLLFIIGVFGWVISFILVLKLNSVTDIQKLKDQQAQHSLQIKDLLTKEIDAVYSKCEASLTIGKNIKWKGQFSLVEKYCTSPIISGDINNIAKCKEILKCKPSNP